jgi:tetratricopeptide (TPR) repeat protein
MLRLGVNCGRTWWGLLLGWLLAWASVPALALSGNAQINLAGAGKFDELALGIEQMVGREPMKVADWHALCFAYSRIKRYSRIMDCLDNFEKALSASDKRSRLFGLDDATPTAYQMRAEALIELGQYEPAMAQTERVLTWYRSEQSDDVDILINALAARSLASGLLGKRADAEKYAAELEALPLGMLGGDQIGAKSLAMARVNMALGRWQKTLDALAQDKTLGLRSFLDNLASGAFLRGVNNWVWIELPRGFMQNKALFELGRMQEAKTGYDRMLSVPQIAANGEIYWLVLLDRRALRCRKTNWSGRPSCLAARQMWWSSNVLPSALKPTKSALWATNKPFMRVWWRFCTSWVATVRHLKPWSVPNRGLWSTCWPPVPVLRPPSGHT